MLNQDPILNRFQATVVVWFGGAPKMPKAPKQQDAPLPPVYTPEPLPAPPAIVIPEAVAPTPIPPPPPTATESNLEAQNKSSQAKADAKRRKGVAASLIAGETGGYKSSATGTGSLLG